MNSVGVLKSKMMSDREGQIKMSINSLTFARLVVVDGYISGLYYDLDEARIVAGVLSPMVKAKVYSGKAEGQISDLARQLVRSRTDAYVFYVEDRTLAATVELCLALRNLRPAAQAFVWGNGAWQADPTSVREPVERLSADSAERLAADLNTLLQRDVFELEGASAYLARVATADDAARIGMSGADASLLTRELAWLDAQSASIQPLIQGETLSREGVEGILAALATRPGRVGRVLRLQGGSLQPDDGPMLIRAGVDKIILVGEVSAASNLDGWNGKIEKAGETEGAARASLIGYNGVIAYLSGLYVNPAAPAAIHHFATSKAVDRTLRHRALDKFRANMAIRSAEIVFGEIEAVDDPATETGAPPQAWPSHTYTISSPTPIDSSGAGIRRVSYQGSPARPRTFVHVPLAQAANHVPVPEQTTVLTIRSTADVAELERRLELFHQTGQIELQHADHPVFFENSCRWLTLGSCRLPDLRRLQVLPDGALSSCGDAGAVGSIEDTYEDLLSRTRQARQIKEVERGCALCPVRDQCSQCSQLPDTWGGRYCDIRQRFPQAAFFFELSSLRPLLNRQEAMIGNLDLRISSPGLPTQFYRGPQGDRPATIRPVLIATPNSHFAWWRGTLRLVRMSAPLAHMAEGWWAGGGEADLVESLASDFSVEPAIAALNLNLGLEKLKTAGVIQ